MKKLTENIIPILIILSVLMAIAVVATQYNEGDKKPSKLDNLSGPSVETILPKLKPTPWQNFHEGNKNRLSILLTDPSAYWLDFAHALKTIGIPFSITTDINEALQHQVVIIYPLNVRDSVNSYEIELLTHFTLGGGTVVGIHGADKNVGLDQLFGVKSLPLQMKHTKIVFQNPERFNFTNVREREISIGNKGMKNYIFPSRGFNLLESTAIAVYEDGDAAITERRLGKGRLIAVGLDLGQYIHKGYSGRSREFSRPFMERQDVAETKLEDYIDLNVYEPSIDNFLRFMKHIYQEGESDAICLRTVPFDRALTVILSHDMCFSSAYDFALDFAKFEKEAGITTTYFVQTKYILDYLDYAFFNEQAIKILNQIKDLGLELGSHSVSHGQEFKGFRMGTGKEEFPEYNPYNVDKNITIDGSILGELRISKFLIEKFTKNTVVSFRAGFLSDPLQLPEALNATGYLYDSSVLAYSSLTHLPFQLNYNNGATAELNIFEFPITDDEEERPYQHLGRRFNFSKLLNISKNLENYGGVLFLLIHPTMAGEKLEFEKELVTTLKDTAWFGSLKMFGAWWAARNQVEVDVVTENGKKIVYLNAPVPISGLTLQLPNHWMLDKDSNEVNNIVMKQEKNQIQNLSKNNLNNIILNTFSGHRKLIFIEQEPF